MKTAQKLIPVREAADRLDLRGADIYRLIDEGRLPGFKDKRGLIVVPEESVAMLEVQD